MPLPERIFFCAVGDHETYVDDAVLVALGDGGAVATGFSELALNEDDEVAFGVADAELAVLEREVGLDVVGFEVALELGRVGGGEGDCGQADVGLRRWRSGEEFNPLRVIDRIDPHAVDFFALEAEGVAVELLRGCRIGGVEAGEGDAGDGRAAAGPARESESKAGEQEDSSQGTHGTNCNEVAAIGQR